MRPRLAPVPSHPHPLLRLVTRQSKEALAQAPALERSGSTVPREKIPIRLAIMRVGWTLAHLTRSGTSHFPGSSGEDQRESGVEVEKADRHLFGSSDRTDRAGATGHDDDCTSALPALPCVLTSIVQTSIDKLMICC